MLKLVLILGKGEEEEIREIENRWWKEMLPYEPRESEEEKDVRETSNGMEIWVWKILVLAFYIFIFVNFLVFFPQGKWPLVIRVRYSDPRWLKSNKKYFIIELIQLYLNNSFSVELIINLTDLFYPFIWKFSWCLLLPHVHFIKWEIKKHLDNC